MEHGPISVFLHSLGGGGAERVMLNLANGLADRGLPVHLVLGRDRGALRERVDPRIARHELGTERVAVAAVPLVARLARYLRRERPAALITTFTVSSVLSVWARALARVPTRVVVTEHTDLVTDVTETPTAGLKGAVRMARWAYPRAHALVAVSGGVADAMARATGVSRDRIRVIYNPVVSPTLLEQASAPLEDPWLVRGAPPTVLAVGRLEEPKQPEVLLRAFALLRRERPLRLLLLGEGPQRPALEALARELGIEPDLRMPGFVPNPAAYMSRAAVLALSSSREGLPTVLIEALACGCPVVSTDCPSGPREVLEDGRYGRLVPVGDPEALASALEAALAEEPDRDALRVRARAFTIEAAVDRYLEAMGLPLTAPLPAGPRSG